MATETLVSTAITNADASPIISNQGGKGAPAELRSVSESMLIPASASAGSTVRLVRIPTNAKVKHVWFESEAMAAGKFNLSVYFSDSYTDGTAPANRGLIVPTTGDQFFASDIDCASAVLLADFINESGNNPPQNRNKELWDALALTSDPKGYFDLVAVVHTTAITTGAKRIGAQVDFYT